MEFPLFLWTWETANLRYNKEMISFLFNSFCYVTFGNLLELHIEKKKVLV